MPNLSQNLYITYTNQKARDLKTSIANPLDRVITLDSFILELFEQNDFRIILDEIIGSSIIYNIIEKHKIDYFSYLSNSADSLNTIYNFIIKCNRNNISFDKILKSEKLQALLDINNYYQKYKQVNNLCDISDIEKVVSNIDINIILKKYNEIYIDNFDVENISFIKSYYQKLILKKLSIFKSIQLNQTKKIAKLIKPLNEVFDNIDEIKTALKITRKLLLNGATSDEILIVASDINEYAPLYKLFLDEYGLKGYSSTGTKLSNYFNSNNDKVKIAKLQLKSKINTIEQLYKKLNLKLKDNIIKKLKDNITILDDKIAIELTEPNQIIGLNKIYKHIIFIGTDINHFPPKASDNFMYSYDDELNYFYANNYFTSSQTQFNELNRIADKLYIISANYSGKRELTPSIIIPSEFDETIDISNIKSKNDIAFENKTTINNFDINNYYEIKVNGFIANHLSASQINKYQTCPLSYLYNNKFKVQSPRQSEEGFDVMEQGSLMHLCYELFGVYIKEYKIKSIDKKCLCDIMYKISTEAYNHEDIIKNRTEENIHHKIFLSNLQAGLKNDKVDGLLVKFVNYYIQNADEFNYFQDTQFEKEFLLDDKLKSTKDNDNYFIKGFIDRFDNLENSINIVDYKSKKINRKDKQKQEEIDTLKDVQLALYILYAKQNYPNKHYDAHLLSFKGNEVGVKFAELSNDEIYTDKYEEELKELIYQVKDDIEDGKYNFDNSDEKVCEHCDIKFLCHEVLFNKMEHDNDSK